MKRGSPDPSPFAVISGDFWITSFLRQKHLYTVSLMIHCLYVQVHFVKDWWRDVASSGKAEEVSCRYVAWRCSNSCKCLKWSPRIEAARGSTKGSCSWWKYAVSWCPSPSEVLSWKNQSDWRWLIYLNGQAVFRLKISYYLEDAVLPLLGTGYMVYPDALYPTHVVISKYTPWIIILFLLLKSLATSLSYLSK